MGKSIGEQMGNWFGDKVYQIKEELRPSEGGVVGVWDVTTKILSYISLLEIICCFYKKHIGYERKKYSSIVEKKKKKKIISVEDETLFKKMETLYRIINVWVSCHVFLAVLASLIVFYCLTDSDSFLIYGIAIYGSLRVFEIIIKQIRVILFDTIGKKAVSIKSPRRSIILLIHNMVEMIFWFATTLMVICLVEEKSLGKNYLYLSDAFYWGDFIKCSTLQFTTFGDSYTVISSMIGNQSLLINIAFWEILIGFIIIVISFARLFSFLPPVENQIIDE
ncbi:MAG: hypothetical protein PWP56_771 [Acetobacterium sp.]|nr:hypothetical protein [Acetobacterium sp.]